MTNTKKRGGKGWMKSITPFRKKHAKRLLQKHIGKFFNEKNDGQNTELENKIKEIEAKFDNYITIKGIDTFMQSFQTRIENLERTQPKDMDNTSSSDNVTEVNLPLPPPGPPQMKTLLTANERRQAAAEMNELLEKVDPAPIDPFVNENLLGNRNIGQKEVGVEQQDVKANVPPSTFDKDLIDIKSPLTSLENLDPMRGGGTKKRGNMYKTTQRRIHKRLKTNKKKHVPKRKKTHKK